MMRFARPLKLNPTQVSNLLFSRKDEAMTGFPAIQDGTITVGLSRYEAMVLLEWLAAHGENLPTSDRAEQIVLWRVEAQLEKALVEQFSSNYGSLLGDARAKVREAALDDPAD